MSEGKMNNAKTAVIFAAIGLLAAVIYFSTKQESGEVTNKKQMTKQVDTEIVSTEVRLPGTIYRDMFELNGKLMHVVMASGLGDEFWVSDGTDVGTKLLKDINPGMPGIVTSSWEIVNGLLFFSPRHEELGFELWKSDGTPEGTQLVKDIYPGKNENSSIPHSSGASTFVGYQDKLYFSAFDNKNSGLWVSDGTTQGTHLIIGDGATPVAALTSGLLFTRSGADGQKELWIYEGEGIEAKYLQKFAEGSFYDPEQQIAVLSDTLVFAGTTPDGTQGLWRTDGTAAGTYVISNINDGKYSGIVENFTVANDALFFIARADIASNAEGQSDLWVTDGTDKGTRLVKKFIGTDWAFQYGSMVPVGSQVFYSVHSSDDLKDETGWNPRTATALWVSDGTQEGTFALCGEDLKNKCSGPASMYEINGGIYFSADDGVHGDELWTSDGTVEGTRMQVDIFEGKGSSDPDHFISYKDAVYFSVLEKVSGPEGEDEARSLWRTDGTAENTVRVKSYD